MRLRGVLSLSGLVSIVLAGLGLLPATAGASVTFSTPGVQTFTVPSDVSEVTVSATGAAGGQGGDDGPCVPGRGGLQQATLAVAPGAQLSITVGGRGGAGVENPSGGLNVGGAGGVGGGASGGTVSAGTFNAAGGGGGGASTISSGGSPLLEAGGGGGCGTFGGPPPDTRGNGGNDGAPGFDGSTAKAGGAGTQAAGGAGGADATPTDGSGGNGSAGQGGGGAGGSNLNAGGGGGGGGYFGGGGGGGDHSQGASAGGGGGSDFVVAGASNVTLQHGVGTGDGQVTITPLPAATAQPATNVTTNSATLNGIVNPNGTATTYHFEYGPTIAYGTKVPVSDAAVGSDSGNHSVLQPVSGLTPGAVYHYRIVATNSGGTTTSADMTLNLVTVVSGATQSSKTWREPGNAKLVVSSRKRARLGTTFKFTLSRAASVRFDFTQPAPGRKVNGKCVAQNRHNTRKRRCTRTVVRGGLSVGGHAGQNSVRFFGWLSRHKKLKPGKYTVVITATTPGTGSTSQKLKFTIVK